MKSSDNTLLLAGLFVLIVVIIALIVYYTRPGETKISEQTSDDTPLKVENLTFTRTLNPDPSVGDGVSGYTIEPYGVEYVGKSDYNELSRNVTFTMKWSNAPGFNNVVKGFEVEHWVRDTSTTSKYVKKKTYNYYATLAKVGTDGPVVDFKDFKENKVNMICSDGNVGANVGKCTYSVVGDNAFKLFAVTAKTDTTFSIADSGTHTRVILYNGIGDNLNTDDKLADNHALKISTNQLSVTLSMTTPDISYHIPTKPTDTTSRTIIDKTVYSISSSDGTNISSLVKQFGYKGGVYLTTQKGSGGKRFTFTFEDGDILGYKKDNTFVKQTTATTDTEKFIFEIVDRKKTQGKIRQAASRFLGATAKGIGNPETVRTTAEKDRKYLSFNTDGKLKLYKQKDSGLTQAIFNGFTWTFNTRIADSLTMPTGQINESRTGDCVAISGDYALVGQPGFNGDRGRVVAYTRNPSGKWIMGTTFALPIRSDPPGMFGSSISIDGDYAVIGEPGANRVYIVKKVNGVWQFASDKMVKITPTDGGGGFFGGSVSISGNYMVIGEPSNNKVHLYWIKDISKVETITGLGGNFGGSVSISGDRIIVGAKMDGTDGAGSVSIYKFNKRDLSINSNVNSADTKKIVGIPWKDSVTGALEKKLYFGTSVAIQGEYAFVGAPGFNKNNGRVYVFKLGTDGGWTRENNKARDYYTGKPVIGSGNATTAYDTIEHPQTSNLADGEEIAEKMYFGKELDISGNKLVISSGGGDGGGGENNVRIYTRSATKMWNDRETDNVPVKLIEPPIKSKNIVGSPGGSLFGYSVSIDGDYVIIGEPKKKNGTATVDSREVDIIGGASYITEV